MTTEPVLMITDLGWEIDDQLALAYICGSPHLELAALVTTAYHPEENAPLAYSIMDWLGAGESPMGIGSRIDSICGDGAFEDLFREGAYPGLWREPSEYHDGQILIAETVKKYGGDLNVLVTAPMTDLAKAMAHTDMTGIKGLFVQGSARCEDGMLIPDDSAYNVRVDRKAAEEAFRLQEHVPFTVVGKHAAYQVSLDSHDFFDWIHNAVGWYLNTEALKIVDFMWNTPEAYYAIYGDMGDQVLSAPYDAVAAQIIARPDLFAPTRVGAHRLIGMQKDDGTLPSPLAVKEDLKGTLDKVMPIE